MSNSQLKPIILWGHHGGPNPWKVAFVLEELNVPYEQKIIEFGAMKEPPYESININGRVPAIQDPNTGITLWESGAILEYLVETYDKDKTVSFAPGTPEYFHAKQWLHFQVSGQGPYFGQAVWFNLYHPEQVESAKDRYYKEVLRVSGVINRALEGKEWLVGGKYSYADVAFVPWFLAMFSNWWGKDAPGLFQEKVDIKTEFPNLSAWLERLRARPAVAKVLDSRFA